MNISRWLSFFILLLIILGCSKEKDFLKNFDTQAWQGDRNGCSREREQMVSNLISQKEKLLGLNQMEMVEALGKPDQQEISKRSEKFFYYFVEPSQACPSPNASPKRLIIRFNAVGLAKEIHAE